MAPEFVPSRNVSIKLYIFSYGVVLLEIVSGLRNRCLDPNAQEENLPNYGWKVWNEGKHINLVN
ncbi:G-type lectin S-receptor-like serine/threonine-protein kinase SD1-13 [Bienertia sinuspersici]